MQRVDFQLAILTAQRDYVEMPDLKLTMSQAARLWTLPADVCRAVMGALLATGFLEETKDGAYRRCGTPPVDVYSAGPLTWTVGRKAVAR